MKIVGLQKLTLIDYPGRLAATVFLAGCNFRCPFCYSSELVLSEKIELQPRISEKEFFTFLKKRKDFLEGIVICGGEPTIHLTLPQFIKKIKNLNYLVKLDTNGSYPEMLKKLIKEKLVDYVAMDVKAPFNKYERAAGMKVDLDKIKKSIDLIKNSGIDYEFRTTVVPSIHAKEDIVQIAKEIAPAKRYYLQNFRPEKTLNPEMEKVSPYSKEFLLETKEEIKNLFEFCEVRD